MKTPPAGSLPSEVAALIQIDEEIAVPASPERVWQVVSDPAEVVGCVDGAELGDSHEDGSFDGTLVVKFGAVRVKFRARISLDTDTASREGTLTAKGNDGQGATRFSANATFLVTEDGDGARVRVSGQVTLAGKLASIIEAGAGAVVSRMTKEFSDELVRRCAGDEAVEPSLHRMSVWARVRAWWLRLVHRRQTTQSGVPSGTAE